jgi:hypothetical protein
MQAGMALEAYRGVRQEQTGASSSFFMDSLIKAVDIAACPAELQARVGNYMLRVEVMPDRTAMALTHPSTSPPSAPCSPAATAP